MIEKDRMLVLGMGWFEEKEGGKCPRNVRLGHDMRRGECLKNIRICMRRGGMLEECSDGHEKVEMLEEYSNEHEKGGMLE